MVAGRICEPPVPMTVTHDARLIERHEISVERPTTAASDDANADLTAVMTHCARQASAWAADAGLTLLNCDQFSEGDTVGVRFDVVIGVGPGGDESHAWGWSARWDHWAAVFRQVARRQRGAAADPADPTDAKVIPMFSGPC